MPDPLRLSIGSLWLFHGATIERALETATHWMGEAADDPATTDELRRAASEEAERLKAALVSFRKLGEELQK